MRTPFVVLLSTVGCAPYAADTEVIAFSSGRSGNGDIYVVEAPGSLPRLIVGTEASEGTVRFDPYGRRLVYSRFHDDGATVMTGTTELFDDPNGDVAPTWSTSGQIAYVVEDQGGADMYVARRDGSEAERVTFDQAIERYPAWDPSGRRLAYAKELEAGWDLYVLEVESGVETRMTFDGTYVGHPNWSPVSEEIAFDRMYGGQTEIVVLNLATREIRRLTENQGNDLLPSWSSDGTVITFAGVRADNWDVWTVTADGGQVERVTTDPAFDGGPIFMPASLVR